MEARAVAAGLGIPRPKGPGPSALYRPPFDLELHTIGVRAVRLPPDEAFRPETGVVCVIMAGLAGALDPELRVGDVVLDAPWDAADLQLDFEVVRGRVHSATDPVATARDKAALFHKTAAVAVDMEQSALRARAGGVPVIGLRAISDTADEDLDPAVLGLVDPLGRPRPLAVAAYLARNPIRMAHLVRLGRSSNLALANLGRAVRALVDCTDLLSRLFPRTSG